MKKPNAFKEKVEKNCFFAFPDGGPAGEKPKLDWIDHLQNHEDSKPYFESLMDVFSVLRKAKGPADFWKRPTKEPFVGLLHGDMWCNNTMQIFENGKPITSKILDLQIYSYGSSICDLLFFIWTSIQYNVLKTNYEELIHFYHNVFVNTLKKFDVDTTVFNSSKFLETIEEDAPFELIHILFMTGVVKGRKEEAALDMTKEFSKMVEGTSTSDEAKEKMVQIVVEFGKRGWLREPKYSE